MNKTRLAIFWIVVTLLTLASAVGCAPGMAWAG
jgi:hypothetical protein